VLSRARTWADVAAERKQTTVYFDQDIAKRLKVHCAVEGAEMSATVTEAVRRYLDALDAGDA